MMSTMDNRTITAYFASSQAAREVANELRTIMEVQGPKVVTPVAGKPFRIIIVLPDTMSPMTLYPDPRLLSRIQNLIMRWDGTTSQTTP